MSFWVYLLDPITEEVLTVSPHSEGGVITVGGSDEASLNVTYNYSSYFYLWLDKDQGLRWLNGKKAADTIEKLTAAVTALGTEKAEDYWASTSGNAGHSLSILLSWAKANPEGVWSVS